MTDPTAITGFSWNKTIASLIPVLLILANQVFGTSINLTDTQVSAISTVLALLIPALVFLIPNRVNSTQAAQIVAATKDDNAVQIKAAQIVAADRAGV